MEKLTAIVCGWIELMLKLGKQPTKNEINSFIEGVVVGMGVEVSVKEKIEIIKAAANVDFHCVYTSENEQRDLH